MGLIKPDENDADMLPQAPSRPGEIDNSKLVSEESSSIGDEPELQRTLREGDDYSLVPQEVWRKLHEWYAMLYVCLTGFMSESLLYP